MNLNKKHLLEETYQNFMRAGFDSNNQEILSEVAEFNIMGFGSTADEKIFSLKEFQELLKRQKLQTEGLKVNWEIKPLYRHITEGQNIAIYADDVFLIISTEVETIELYLRFSVIFEYKNEKWKAIHWHGSKPENIRSEEDTWGIDSWKKKTELLENEVAERTADLAQKNRELEIEAALEKVRSRSMSMHKTDELSEVITLVFEKLKDFNFPVDKRAALMTFSDGSKDLYGWINNPEFSSAMKFHLSYFEHPVLSNLWEAKNNGDDFLMKRYTAAENQSFLNHIFNHTDFKHTPDEIKAAGLAAETFSVSIAFQKNTAIFIYDYSGIVLSENEMDILIRFAKVFEQTYTRFLDLQKAEAQARESEIELALERVRARTMAMQHSDELTEASEVLDQQVRALGIKTWGCAFHIYTDDPEGDYEWFSSREGTLPFYKTPRENFFLKFYEKGQAGELFHVEEFLGEECKIHYEYLMTIPVMGDALRAVLTAGGSLPESQYDHIAFFKHGFLLFITYNPDPESHDIFKRFAKVFEQTYTRFLDLQKAEAQAREAQIGIALERVRSRSLSMHHTSELTEVIKTVNQQFKSLKVDISGGAFIVINKDLENGFYCWGAGGVGDYVKYVLIPFIDRPIYQNLSNGIKNRKSFFTEYYDASEKRTFFHHLFRHVPFNDTPVSRQEQLLSMESGYARSCVVCDHTSIFIINHAGRKFTDEENELLRQMGRVFEQAYTRFLDLEKAEIQAKQIREERDRLEITLRELKVTQAQLVQQEKLASLGQLTAGIAHEIKNPLNFVNNFSELGSELIDEVFEEMRKLEDSDTKEEIIAILNDVKGNLTKVHEHGTRANSIVSSMLQHSRGGSGKKELTNLNALIKEYVNLSFHGMRAGKNPINAEINLQLDDQISNVLLVSEDFSRVLLNLCNNAFDAMRSTANKRIPKLTIRTKLQSEKVIIEVEDNGPGIPIEIKDQILQPFFTTKKGTEGTGLGLSITHDIVKAHGGELNIESYLEGGARFIISIPEKPSI